MSIKSKLDGLKGGKAKPKVKAKAPAKPRTKKETQGKSKRKSNAGRPTVMTPEVIRKFEEAFALGCSDLEACFYADVGRQALYNYQADHPEFVERKLALKKRPILLARKVVIDSLLDNDRNSAHKVLDRHDGQKQILAGDPENPIQTVTRIELVPLANGNAPDKPST